MRGLFSDINRFVNIYKNYFSLSKEKEKNVLIRAGGRVYVWGLVRPLSFFLAFKGLNVSFRTQPPTGRGGGGGGLWLG